MQLTWAWPVGMKGPQKCKLVTGGPLKMCGTKDRGGKATWIYPESERSLVRPGSRWFEQVRALTWEACPKPLPDEQVSAPTRILRGVSSRGPSRRSPHCSLKAATAPTVGVAGGEYTPGPARGAVSRLSHPPSDL